ncbi:DNA polymerase subunit B [uncultured Caudovirales phage]|uniref:DNA-directed DNA polymerase n=1 Tax=uncultured Caudovirales phage TaxID=2100421 RepID=A0A6J5M511_9CAUD|nr:DNA polymerase subunit B [uncultured Caudovirales phage]
MIDLTKLSDLELKAYAKKLSFDISKYHNFQLTKKIQLNSAYGAMGNQYFRFYDIRLAEAVTLSGQLVIQWIARDINKYLNNMLKSKDVDYVIAIDTDSIYLNLRDLVYTIYKDKLPDDKLKIVDLLDRFSEEKLQAIIDKSCTDLKTYLNARSQKMQMKRESIADKAIWTAKKRYILNVYDNEGVRFDSPKLKLQGIEAIKSSTPEVCRQKIKDAINVILTKSQKDLHKYIDDFKTEFKKLSPESVAFPRGCNGLSTYADSQTIYKKGTPIHVRGALVYNYLIKSKKLDKKYPCIQDGDKIKFLYMKEPNHIHENVITMSDSGLPVELNLHKYVDYELQFEKTFLDPLKIILDSIKWTTKKQISFDDL